MSSVVYFVSTDEELLSLKEVVVVVEGNSPPRNCNDVDSIENPPLLAPPAIYVVREDILAIRRRDVANIMDSSSGGFIIVGIRRGEELNLK